MAFVLIVGLVVAVIALLITLNQQSKTINNYEKELTKKARKGRKNATK
jgi:hypothetical protein